MINLPRCIYPSASDKLNHGIQHLPQKLTLVNLGRAQDYRSKAYKSFNINSLDSIRILELSRMIAKSFVQKEPMNRHLNPPEEFRSEIQNIIYSDPLGSHHFGEWNKENIFNWFIRLMVLTDPTSPIGDIKLNSDLFNLSIAIEDNDGALIGGAYNITLSPITEHYEQRTNDPFLNALGPFIESPLSLIIEQEHQAIKALCDRYPSFRKAQEERKIGCHFLVARSPSLPVIDTFELVAASTERFQELGYKFIVISATNEWTGAACEVLGGTRIHYAPYRDEKRLVESKYAKKNQAHSSDGYLSDKDSGSMFYVIRLI